MPPGFDEGRRMTRSARRAHPEPTPEPPEPQESRSSSEESLDIEAERNANIEARIQRLKAVIQSRKEHLRDIFVLYNHRANPGTYCTPEDFADTAPDRSTAVPPHLSPLLATLGEWQPETPPETPPMLQELPESVLEEDKLDVERLQELVPKPVQASPPPIVVPLPVVVEDGAASEYSDAQDMDIDPSSSPRVKAEPEPEPEQEAEEQLEQPLALAEESKEETVPVEEESLADEPTAAAAALDEDSPMTEPPPSPPPASLPLPASRAASVATALTPAAAAAPSPLSQLASPPPLHASRAQSLAAAKSPTPHAPTPMSVAREPSLAVATPRSAADDQMHTPRAATATPAPKSPTPIPSAPTLARRELTAPAQEATPRRDATPALSVRELTPALSAKAATPAFKDATPAPKSPTPALIHQEATPAREEETPASRDATPVPKARTPAPRDKTPFLKEPTPLPREASLARGEPSSPPREETPAKDPTPSPSPAAIAQTPQAASPARQTVPTEEGESPHDEEHAKAPEDEDEEMSDGTSTPTVEAVLGEDEDPDAMQTDADADVAPADVPAEDVQSNATTPRPTTVSPAALEPPPVTRAPAHAVTFNSALFRPQPAQAPEPHASNAFTSPQRRVARPPAGTYIPATTSADFALALNPTTATTTEAGVLLVPESEFTRRLALPPLAALPPTFNHTVKPAKLQRKREKEKERKEKEGAAAAEVQLQKEFIPLGLNRWAALVRANPVHKHIKKAPKVLFTADWRLAQDELLFLRAVDRIDRLKQDGLWSFRQPKRAKQPVHIKVHWDYLLDEMKWMRTDFREERKWKVALAHELAHACRAFVLAAPEERPAMCAKYRLRREEPGVAGEEEEGEDVVMDMNVDVDDEEEEKAPPAVPPSTPPPEVPPPEEPPLIEGWQPPAYGTPDPLGPPSPERLPNYDPETGTMSLAQDAQLDVAEDFAAPLPVAEMIDDVAMKTEETEQPLGLGLGTSAEVDAGDSDEGGREATAAAAAVPDDSAVLRDAGQNPTLGSTGGASSSSKLGPYKALRDPILALGEDALWLDFDDLKLDDAEREKLPLDGVPLPEIFPELDVYEPLPPFDGDIAMNILQVKDHPSDKRVDETVSGKLASTSIFMDTKPTLVGALNPAQNWRNGKWVNLDDAVIHPPPTPADDKDWDHHMSDLFKMHGTSATPRNSSIPKMPVNAHLRASDLPWTKADDDLLKSIVDRFPNNWHLVAEWFNSSRVTIDMDRRSPWDCCERWHRKFGLASEVPQAAEQPRSPSPNLYESSNARTLKRFASNAALGTNTEPRKRRRLLHLQDAVRKMGKKREATQRAASQNKRTLNANVHETHTKIAKSSLSALELTRLKIERDTQERQRAQAHAEAIRNAAASIQQNPVQRQMLLAQQQQLGLMRAPGQIAQLPGQGMPKLAGVQGLPPGMMVNMQQHMQQLSQQQRAHIMRTQQAMQQAAQAQQAAGVVAGAQAGSSASPHLQSSSPQTSPPRPGPSGPQGAAPRPGSTLPLDPAAFQIAQQQQALHAAMMQGYSNEEQMRQRIGIQNMLAGSSTTGAAGSQGSGQPGAS